MNFNGLTALYSSIRPFLSDDIIWRVQDSGKCRDTEKFFLRLDNDFVVFDNSGDSGIYNALNKTLDKLGRYYVVCGSDDLLYEDFFHFVDTLKEAPSEVASDIVALPVQIDGKVKLPSKFFCLSVSLRGFIVSHSVGTIIRSSLHDDFGKYSEDYKILSDSMFLTKCHRSGCSRAIIEDVVAGQFGSSGISSTEIEIRIDEAYRYHIELGFNQLFQVFIKMLRRLKYRGVRLVLKGRDK